MYLFFCQEIHADGNAILDREESKHCIQVLRHKAGDVIQFTDGTGFVYEGVITDDNPKKCRLQILKSIQKFDNPVWYPHIAISIPRNLNRLEWFVEKATEIGVSEITPCICSRTQKQHLRIDRLNKIAVSAIKQSLKSRLPVINDVIKFHDFIQAFSKPTPDIEKFIAYCGENLTHFKNAYTPGKKALVMIGPEGDFTPEEVEYAINRGFKPVSLGRSRLRLETAGIVACHVIALLNEV